MAWTLSNFSPLNVRWWPAVCFSYFFNIYQQTRNVRSIGAQVVSTNLGEEEKEERERKITICTVGVTSHMKPRIEQ